MTRQTRFQNPASRGFSLLELLVALFVVVLITSMVTLTVSSGGRDIRIDSRVRSLANVGAYALDEAQLRGTDFGLLLFEQFDEFGQPTHGFAWRERLPGGWREPEHDSDIFEDQLFPAGMELQLELEDSPVDELQLAAGEERDSSPQVLFYASGETTPGALELRRDSGELLWRVQWDLLGRFELLRRGVEEEEEEL